MTSKGTLDTLDIRLSNGLASPSKTPNPIYDRLVSVVEVHLWCPPLYERVFYCDLSEAKILYRECTPLS